MEDRYEVTENNRNRTHPWSVEHWIISNTGNRRFIEELKIFRTLEAAKLFAEKMYEDNS